MLFDGMLKTDGMSRAYHRRTTELYREEMEGKVNWYNVAVYQVLTFEDDKNSNPHHK